MNLPIVVYKDSILTLNGKELDKDDYNLSTIGTPTVSSQEGHNKLVLSYNEPGWLFVALLTPIIVLAVICLQCLYTKINIKRLPLGNLFALFFNHDIIKLACFYASKSTFKSIFE